MVVIRMSWHVDSPHMDEALKAMRASKPPKGSVLRGGRLYRARTGHHNTLAVEWEFDSLADWETFSAQLFASPENAPFFRRWAELAPLGSTTEVWNLVESF